MSTFERKREERNEIREFIKVRKENIAKYFFDLSKLTFAALVLGLGGTFLNVDNWEWLSHINTVPLVIWYILGIGFVGTIVFASIGCLMFKLN